MAGKNGKPRGLGRGLSALMADVAVDNASNDGLSSMSNFSAPIESVHPNPNQPRRVFSNDQLKDLAASIKEKGIIQPLIVRVDPVDPNRYQIVAGERRWRAAQMAKLHQIPIIVRNFSDTEVLEVAIIENIQRSDLNPIEEAAGYRQLMGKFGHTQEKLAEVLGKSRSHIANLMRLLTLPEPVQAYLQQGQLTMGHARALITSENPLQLAELVIRDGLSVRQTEKMAKSANQEKNGAKPSQTENSNRKNADTRALEADLSANLRMKVTIDHSSEKENGRLTVSYNSLDDLDELCRILSSNH